MTLSVAWLLGACANLPWLPGDSAAPESPEPVVEVPVEEPPAVPQPAAVECPEPPPQPGLVIGAVERVRLAPEGLVFSARIDTGAETSSIDARDVTTFERDGKRWVRFSVPDRRTGESHLFERRVIRRVRVKRQEAEDERRYVVSLRMSLGRIDRKREFTLANREEFEYPVLIGRNFLRDAAIVDVSRERTQRIRK